MRIRIRLTEFLAYPDMLGLCAPYQATEMRTPYLHRSLAIALAFALQCGSLNAQEAEFAIKGWVLGQSPASACRGEPTTDLQDLVRQAGVLDIEMPVVSCAVKIDSIAGVAVAEPAKLLFWKGRLVRVSMDIGWLDLEALAAVRGTLLDTYGKPVTRRSNPFVTDKWSKKYIQIELERTDRLPSNVGVYLTESQGWTEYQRVSKQVDDRLALQKKLARKNDLSN